VACHCVSQSVGREGVPLFACYHGNVYLLSETLIACLQRFVLFAVGNMYFIAHLPQIYWDRNIWILL